jgi:hypothetical protein
MDWAFFGKHSSGNENTSWLAFFVSYNLSRVEFDCPMIVGLLLRSVGFVFVLLSPLTWSTICILSPKKARVPDELAQKPTDQ